MGGSGTNGQNVRRTVLATALLTAVCAGAAWAEGPLLSEPLPKVASVEYALGLSGNVYEGHVYSTTVNAPYACSSGRIYLHSTNPGIANGRSSLRWILSINGYAVLDGTSGTYTVPRGLIQPGNNTFRVEFVDDGDGVAEVTQVLNDGYIRIEEQTLPDGSFKARGQGPVVVHEGDTLQFTVESAFACAEMPVSLHSTDRGGIEEGRSSLPYVVYIDGQPVENGTTTITVPSGFLQQGQSEVTIYFKDDGDADDETTLILEDSYIQVKEKVLPAGSFRIRGQAPVVVAENDELTFTVNSPHVCALAKILVHMVDRGGVDSGVSYIPYLVYVNGQPVYDGTTSTIIIPSGIIQQGDNEFVIAFKDDGDATGETTLVLEDSYIQISEVALPEGSFRARGTGPTVITEGDSLTFSLSTPFICTRGSVKVHSVDRGGIQNGRSSLKYILSVNGLAVFAGTSSTYELPSGVLQQGDNTVVLDFVDDGDSYLETTLLLEDSFLQTAEALLPDGAFYDRGQKPEVIEEGDTLAFTLDLDADEAVGEIKLHAADRGGTGNGTTALKYTLTINGAVALANKSLTTRYDIPAGFTVAGPNTFVIQILDDGDSLHETALALDDSYIYVPGENWPDADGDGVPDRIEGGDGIDTDGDGTPDYLDSDSDDDGFIDGDEYRSGYDPYDAESIPVDVMLLDGTVSPAFWRNSTLELMLAPVSFIIPDESGTPPVLPPFEIDSIVFDPPGTAADVDVERVEDMPKPLAALLLFDGSDSLGANDKARMRVAAGKAFVERLRPGDEAAVLEFARYFSNELYRTGIHQDFTSDHGLLEQAMDALGDTGGTPLYESLLETLAWFGEEKAENVWQRVVILFSDGEPNSDTYRDACIEMALELRIPVVTVGLADAAEPGTEAGDAMRSLAEATYGLYVPADSPGALANIYASLAAGLLGDAYRVTIVFSPPPAIGTEITVTLSTNYGTETFAFVTPGVPDTDGDGLLDSEEDANANGVVDTGETDPTKRDTDGDGLNDYDEIYLYDTDPTDPDMDGDGVNDGDETDWDSDPNDDDDVPPNLTSMTIGVLTVDAEQFVSVGSNVYESRGYVRINDLLAFSGALRLNFNDLTVTGTGTWKADNVPYVGDVDFYSGPLSIDAEGGVCAGLNAAASLLEVVGLGVSIDSFAFVEGGIQISGELELPPAIDVSVAVDNLVISDTTGIDFEGSVELPDVSFKGFPWGLEDSHLDFNTVENEFGGGGKVNTPKFDVLIEEITIRDGRLETVLLGIGFPDPGINLDSSGVVWLQSVSGGLIDMAPGPPPLKIKAACELTIGPTVGGYRLITGVPELVLDTSGMFTASGTIYLLGGPDEGYEMGNVYASFGTPSSAEPGFRFGATAYLWQHVFEPQMTFSIDFDMNYEGTARGTFDLGEVDLAILGSTVADLVDMALEAVDVPTFDLAATVNNDGFRGTFEVDVLAGYLLFTATMEPGGWPSLDASLRPPFDLDIDWPFKMSPDGYAAYRKQGLKTISGTFTVPAGTGQVLVTLSHQEGSADFTLVDPSGAELTPGDADGSAYGYAADPARGFAFYLLNNPAPGLWHVQVPDPESLGLAEIQAIPVDALPGAALISARNLSAQPNTVALTYRANDTDGVADVSLHYDNDMEGFDGLTIVTGLSEKKAAGGYAEYLWDTSGVAPGSYYVYVKVDDGVHAAQMDYLDTPVTVWHETSVPAPSNLAVALHGGAATFTWGGTKAENLLSYRLHYVEVGAPMSEVVSVAVGSLQSYTIALEPGRSYRVWVTAVDATGAESAPSAEQIVRPMAGQGQNNPPHITSTPALEVAAQGSYTYNILAEDADSDALEFALLTGPAGMTVNEDSGRLNWLPARDQRGCHDVVVTVSDGNGGYDSQEFRVSVGAPQGVDLDSDGLDVLEEVKFATDPALWDTDDDGISDGDEVNIYKTNPAAADTDGDGVPDGDEIAAGSDPLSTRTALPGSLCVTLSPAGALDGGARWRVDGGPWRYSGERVDDVAAGAHSVSFADASGYYTPNAVNVSVTAGETTAVSKGYAPRPQYQLDFNSDGQTNASDIQLVINDVLGLWGGAPCDVDANGDVNAVDVQLIINAVLGLI